MRRNHQEQGSIVMTLMVIVVATGLIVALLTEVIHGQTLSRRAGDSANALQVADAGLNDAVQQIPTVALSADCPGVTAVCFTRNGTVGNGTYTYTATQDSQNIATWHVDAVGIDATGVKRHLNADAAGVSEFNSPMYVNNLYLIGAGAIIDSYQSGLSNATGCTRKGVISLSDGDNVSFTSGGVGSANCTGTVLGTGWSYAMDGCVVWGGANLPVTGQGACPPPPDTKKVATPFPLSAVNGPTSGVDFPTSGGQGVSFTCDAASGPTSLRSGKTYYYITITLAAGCAIDPTSLPLAPIHMFAKDFILGSKTNGQINAPTVGTCPTSATGWSYQDQNKNPALDYCPAWTQNLQLEVPSNANGSVQFTGSGTQVWAIIDAPTAAVTLKSPQLEMWGAMVAGSATVKSQFSWHYDQSSSSITTGKYAIANWREVPL